VAVYDPETESSVPGFTFEQENHINPSVGGTTKATSLCMVSRSQPATSTAANPFLPILVVAIRGTASSVDRMVNLNSKSKGVDSLIVRRHYILT
jgi:hypothetical protein